MSDYYKKGKTFEKKIIKLLQEEGFTPRISCTRGDGGIDIIINHNGVVYAIQCKAYKNKIGPQFVQQLKGSLDGWPLETTVGILVANGANRFTKDAVSAAQSSRYHIILVGINDLIKTIRDYQPQRPVQPLEKEIEETHSEVQQVRSEIAELRDLLISFSKNK